MLACGLSWTGFRRKTSATNKQRLSAQLRSLDAVDGSQLDSVLPLEPRKDDTIRKSTGCKPLIPQHPVPLESLQDYGINPISLNILPHSSFSSSLAVPSSRRRASSSWRCWSRALASRKTALSLASRAFSTMAAFNTVLSRSSRSPGLELVIANASSRPCWNSYDRRGCQSSWKEDE